MRRPTFALKSQARLVPFCASTRPSRVFSGFDSRLPSATSLALQLKLSFFRLAIVRLLFVDGSYLPGVTPENFLVTAALKE